MHLHHQLLTLPFLLQTCLAHPAPSHIPTRPTQLHEIKNIKKSPSDIYLPLRAAANQQRLQQPEHIITLNQQVPISKHRKAPGKGVVAALSKGTINMYSPLLEELIPLEFAFTLSPTYCFHSRKSIEQGAEIVPLIEMMSTWLLDDYSDGITFPHPATLVQEGEKGKEDVSERVDDKLEGPLLTLSPEDRDGEQRELKARDEEEAERVDDIFSATTSASDHQREVIMSDSAVLEKDGRSFSATVDISLTPILRQEDEGEDKEEGEEEGCATDVMERDEWRLLVGLLRSTATVLKDDILGDGKSFSELRLRGVVGGVSVDARWAFSEDEGRGC